MTWHVGRHGWALALLLGVNVATSAQELRVGSHAPELRVAKWIEGAPARFDDGLVHVIVFWSIRDEKSHLVPVGLGGSFRSEQEKVRFSAVSIWEDPGLTDEELAGKARILLAARRAPVTCDVGIDGKAGNAGRQWMEAARRTSLPTAFVVDPDGTVLWIGALDRLMSPLGQVLSDTYSPPLRDKFGKRIWLFDPKKADEEERAIEKKEDRIADLEASFRTSYDGKRYKTAVSICDQALSEFPELGSIYSIRKFHSLMFQDERAAQGFAETLVAPKSKVKMASADLNAMAWTIAGDDSELKFPDCRVAALLAEAACRLDNYDDPWDLDTLAYALFRLKKLDRAIELERNAIELAGKKKSALVRSHIDDLQKHLDQMLKAKAGG